MALRQQMVVETLEPGASASNVARRHELGADQLLEWPRLYSGLSHGWPG
jgi:transposase-like protein